MIRITSVFISLRLARMYCSLGKTQEPFVSFQGAYTLEHLYARVSGENKGEKYL